MVSSPALLPALLSIALLAPAPARAATVWLCGLSDDLTRLVCVADVDATDSTGQSPSAATAQVKGTRFPLDPRGRWVVDLWSPPTETESVARLARATICYRSPGCEVILSIPWPQNAAYLPSRRR
jgi:hypothetical protein